MMSFIYNDRFKCVRREPGESGILGKRLDARGYHFLIRGMFLRLFNTKADLPSIIFFRLADQLIPVG